MKRILLNAFISAMFAAAPAYAVDEHHPDEKPAASKKAPRAAAPVRPGAQDKSAAQMQEHMKKMQDQMARIQKTTDPAERQKLMNEHMQSMQEGMQMMRGMGGGMMREMMGGSGMMGGGMTGQAPKDGAAKSGPMGGGMMSPDMMERRMDMMQMMMEQMMQHLKVMEAAPK